MILKIYHIFHYIFAVNVAFFTLRSGNALIEGINWRTAVYIFLATYFVYDVYQELKEEAKHLKKEFTQDLKDSFHEYYQVLVVTSFVTGMMDNSRLSMIVVIMLGILVGRLINLKINQTYYKE